jgi:hypothetical protein
MVKELSIVDSAEGWEQWGLMQAIGHRHHGDGLTITALWVSSQSPESTKRERVTQNVDSWKEGVLCALGPVEAWLKSASAKCDTGERLIILSLNVLDCFDVERTPIGWIYFLWLALAIVVSRKNESHEDEKEYEVCCCCVGHFFHTSPICYS